MNLLMLSGDRSLVSGRRGAFWQTLEELRKHWERIDVICPSAEGPFPTSVFPNVFLHPSPHGLWYQPLWILWKGKGLSRQRQYTVITVHEYPPFYNGMGAWMLHRTMGVPWVSEIHHVVGYPRSANVQESIGRMLYGPYFQTIARSAAAFRVVNTGMKELLVRFGVRRERIRLVPSFYLDHELLQLDPTIQKKYDIVFCGRLVANKGLEELLEAMRVASPSMTLGMTRQLRLLIIGDGPLRAKMTHHPNPLPLGEGKTASLTFTGWLPSLEGVYRAMQSAKIFVMCSKSEGGPRVALEAMALGLPVIATNVGVVPDVIRDGENGLLTTGTPEDLAQKIGRLLEDEPLRIRLGQRARGVLQVFEQKRLIQEYAHFLQSFASFHSFPSFASSPS